MNTSSVSKMMKSRCAALLLLLSVITSFVSALDNGLYKTPPMGWLSWSRFRCITDCKNFPSDCISESLYKSMGDIMVTDGWLAAGYEYVNIDDCWSEKQRDNKTGRLVPDHLRFPSGMPSLTSYLHQKNLKAGIYGDVGSKTCGSYPGSLNHYDLDAQTFADWKFDSLKFDGCNVNNVSDYERLYPAMTEALNKTSRPMAYICSWPAYVQGHIDYTVLPKYCNSWRAYRDIQNGPDVLNDIINWFASNQDLLVPAAGPGHWNDPDMIVGGNNGLTIGESKIQMAIWAILAAPLMLGADLRTISSEVADVLKNKAVIAVNQDLMGRQGRRVKVDKRVEVWSRNLLNGDIAIVVTHREDKAPFVPYTYDVRLSEVQWENYHANKCVTGTELFSNTAVGTTAAISASFRANVTAFSASMYRLSVVPCEIIDNTVEIE